MSKKLIATAFSSGKFEITYQHLAENSVWKIVGGSEYIGKPSIMEQCDKVTNYFNSVTTVFSIQHVIEEGNYVAINGYAEFSKNNTRVSFVNACDVYEFDETNLITQITSYCIAQK